MDSRLSVPLLTPFIIYSDWKFKMISYLKRQGLYEVSTGIGKESYEYENEWINYGDRSFGIICLASSPSLHYLISFVEYPKDLLTKLDRTFGKHNEDHYSTLERTPLTTIVIYLNVLASTLSNEVVHDEEEAESSMHESIRIEESLRGVTPSPADLNVYEISDISCSHMDDPREYIEIYVIE